MTYKDRFDELEASNSFTDPGGTTHTGTIGGSGSSANEVVASPGNVQSVIDSNAAPAEGRSVVKLEAQTDYDPSSTWNVKDGVDLHFNGAEVMLTSDIDLLHLEPGSRVIEPNVDYSGVSSYTSAVYTWDATLYGRYDESIDSHGGMGTADVVGGRTRGSGPGGSVFYFHADNDTGIGGDHVYNPGVYEHRMMDVGTGIDLHSMNSAYVNSIHMDNLYIQHPETAVHLRGSGVAADLRIENTNVQPGSNTQYGILMDNGDHLFFEGTMWDKGQFSTQVWQQNSGSGGENCFIDHWKFNESHHTDNSGSANNHWQTTDRGVIDHDHGVKFYSSNGVPKSVLKQSTTGGDLRLKPSDGGGDLYLRTDGVLSWDWGSHIKASNGIRIPEEDLTAKGDPGQTSGSDVYFTHDGSGAAPAGLYRADTANSEFEKVEGTHTIAYSDGTVTSSGGSGAGEVVASDSVTLSSGVATVDTLVSTAETATFNVALGPGTSDADVAADIRADSGSGTYVVDIEETDTSVGNPTIYYDITRVR